MIFKRTDLDIPPAFYCRQHKHAWKMTPLRVAIAKKRLQVIRNSSNIITMPSNNLQWYRSGTHVTHDTTPSSKNQWGLLWTYHTCQLLNLVHTELQKSLLLCGMVIPLWRNKVRLDCYIFFCYCCQFLTRNIFCCITCDRCYLAEMGLRATLVQP